VPMTVSWPADTKLFVRGTTATRKRHSAQKDVVGSLRRGPATAMLPSSVTEVAIPES